MKSKTTRGNPALLVIIFLLLMLFANNIYSQTTRLKVITIAMMEMGEVKGDAAGEAQLWYERDSLFLEMKITGAYSPLYYNEKGQGLIITGGGIADVELISYNRIMALRTASDFDQQYPGKTAAESIHDSWSGFPLAIENAYRVCSVVVRGIIANWEQWSGN